MVARTKLKQKVSQTTAYGFSKTTTGLRLISVKLKSGEQEVLLTNILDKKEYTNKTFKALYNLRWRVEEGYKTFKKVLNIEHFTGKTVLSVFQDFHAKVLMQNLSSLVNTQLLKSKKSNPKHSFQISKTQTLAKLKDYLVDFFYKQQLKKRILQMNNLLQNCCEIISENRSFPRVKTDSRRRNKIINYKGI